MRTYNVTRETAASANVTYVRRCEHCGNTWPLMMRVSASATDFSQQRGRHSAESWDTELLREDRARKKLDRRIEKEKEKASKGILDPVCPKCLRWSRHAYPGGQRRHIRKWLFIEYVGGPVAGTVLALVALLSFYFGVKPSATHFMLGVMAAVALSLLAWGTSMFRLYRNCARLASLSDEDLNDVLTVAFTEHPYSGMGREIGGTQYHKMILGKLPHYMQEARQRRRNGMLPPRASGPAEKPAGARTEQPTATGGTIEFTCGQCKRVLRVPARHAGKQGKCKCGAVNLIPGPGSQSN